MIRSKLINKKYNHRDLSFISFQGVREGVPKGLTRAIIPILESTQFKDRNPTREENLDREAKTFERLKRELDHLKKNGKYEQEAMKEKIKESHDQNLEDFQAKA